MGEECDDGGTSGGDGCSATCLVESGYVCSALLVEGGEESSVCASSCGNGVVDYEVHTHTHTHIDRTVTPAYMCTHG